MALKSLFFVSVLVAAFVAPLMVEAQLAGIIGSLIRVQGTVYCTANGNIGINGTATPVFPNAVVQMQCRGNIVSSTTTNNMGIFTILLDPLSFLLSSILSDCNIAVTTPLSKCDSTLPSTGILFSLLRFIGNTLQGLLKIINLQALPFQFLPSS